MTYGVPEPTEVDCRRALKALLQTERIFEKLARRPLPPGRAELLRAKRATGVHSSEDLPVRIDFPASLLGLTLEQVRALCA